MFKELKNGKRLLIEAELKPIQGDRFQPTGFADLGAATFVRPDGTRMLLVESAQSIANRLESTIIGPDNELIESLKGLPYIRVNLTRAGNTTTNSLLEAHRINSPFIISDEKFQTDFLAASEYERQKPLNWQKIAAAIIKYDVNSLLHGVFFSNLLDGRIKMARAISGFIEAENVQEVVSGGVKNNHIDPTGTLRAKNFEKDVYGNVPYQRVEFTAGKITAYFNIDISLLQSYTGINDELLKSNPSINDDLFDLLIGLSLYKIQTFLENGTRLRTACDLSVVDKLAVIEPKGFAIPSNTVLLAKVKENISKCKALFADPPVTAIDTETVIVKNKKEE